MIGYSFKKKLSSMFLSWSELACLFLILFSNFFYDLIYALGYLGSPIEYIFIFIFISSFAYYVFNSDNRNPILLFSFFSLLKIFILIFCILDAEYLFWVVSNGDADRLHIPIVLNMNALDIFPYLTDFDDFATITGRLTHVWFFLFWSILSPFVAFNALESGVMFTSYIANFFLILFSGVLIYKLLRGLQVSIELSSKGVFLFLFSPFLFSWSSMTMKEPMIALIVVLSVRSIFKSNFFTIFLSSFLFLFERLYMIYFTSLVVFLSRRMTLYFKIFVFFLFLGVLYSIFPIGYFFDILLYQITFQENEGKSLAGNGFFQNFLRVIFSPFPFAAFFIAAEQDFQYRVHYIAQLFYVFIMFRILFTRSKFSLLIALILFVNFVLFPYGARQKINLIIPLLSVLYPLYIDSRRKGLKFSSYWRI